MNYKVKDSFLRNIMFFILILLCLLHTSNSFPVTINYQAWDCYDNSSIILKNSFAKTTRNNLLSTLVSNISTAKNGFLTLKQSSGNNQSSPFYGLALCRGDMSPKDCHDCIQIASKLVAQICNGSQAIYWLEDCMLRYSNTSFSSQLQENPSKRWYNKDYIQKDVQNWTNLLKDTLNKVISKASSGDNSGKKYGTQEAWFASNKTYLFTLAQCTPDLTSDNCLKCLDQASSEFVSVLAVGGFVLSPSCTIRYEIFEFYEILNVGPLPPSSSPPSNHVAPSITEKKKSSSTRIFVAIIVPIACVGMLLIAFCVCLSRRKAKKYRSLEVKEVLGDLTTAESLMFELGTLETATNNFSDDQKLGKGGFGSVYKGTLPNGQEIAVKRLSKISGQGVEEFKNEVVLIANLQHRNLVKLLGFCLDGEEKLLVYEFVPNKSLNYFLFGERKQGEVDWNKRYNIIKGIARGLLYLHEDSRPRIIHRDLKAANILLDANMNPKISDFGLARMFKVEQTEDDTSRVVGTYGYMAPEYAMQGQYSSKSDVYSFGVLVLEIVSGKKISSKFNLSRDGDFLSHAWKSLIEEKPLEFMDPSLKESYSSDEVLQCIQIGLWCAQDNTNERPTMSTIVLMLNSDSSTTTIPIPQRPRSFYNSSIESSLVTQRQGQFSSETTTTTSDSISISQNQDTITEMYPR